MLSEVSQPKIRFPIKLEDSQSQSGEVSGVLLHVLREVRSIELLVWFLSLSLEMAGLFVPRVDGVGRGEGGWWWKWHELAIPT